MDEKIEKAIKPLLNMYEQIENDLLVKIASHFSMTEEFLNSDHWKIKKLEEMGLFNKEIVEYLAKYTNKTSKEIKKALEQIKIDTINIGNLNKMYTDGKLKIDPSALINNYTINSIVNSAYSELSGRFIEMSSKIEKATRDAYLDIVETAYLKTSMGSHSYQEAIREAINDLSNDGIKTLVYKTTDEDGNITGIRIYDIEGAVRRETLTASRQLSNNISLEVANELNSEYLYLSEHLQCRPNHFDWQGTIIKREDLEKITHYGEVDGLAGINCRHYVEPYFGDARNDELKHFNKEECTEAYNLSQKQRYLERGIRKWKRKAEMFKANNDLESYSKCKDKVKEWQLRTQDFVDQNNLKRDFTREYVANIELKGLGNKNNYTVDNHPTPQLLGKINIKEEKDIKSLLELCENIIKNDKIENAIVITSDGNIFQCFGNATNVWPDIDLGDKLYDAYVTHNHPIKETNYSFSKSDIKLFEKYNLKVLRGIDEKYSYEINRNKKHILEIPDDFMYKDYGFEHLTNIRYGVNNDIYYMRWENETNNRTEKRN